MGRDSYIQHAHRHGKDGTDPIATAVANDWIYCSRNAGTVADSSPYPFSGGPTNSNVRYTNAYIVHQTDDGSVFDSANIFGNDVIRILKLGTYLIRVRAIFPEGKTGYGMAYANIAGSFTGQSWDYNVVRFQPLSFPDTNAGTDMGAGGGATLWEQLLKVTAFGGGSNGHPAIFTTFWQSSGAAMVNTALVDLQIIRFT